jgi:hypothetical protein
MTKRNKRKMEKFIIMQRLKSFMRQTFDKLYYIVDKDLFSDHRHKAVADYVNRNCNKYWLNTEKYMFYCCQGIYTLLKDEMTQEQTEIDLLFDCEFCMHANKYKCYTKKRFEKYIKGMYISQLQAERAEEVINYVYCWEENK